MKKIRVAVAGNPNVGKTSVFNPLTGLNQTVGNWPGVTVEKREGKFTFGDTLVEVVDLPGVYSLTARTIDQKIARDFLIREKPDVVVDVVDASNLERNLLLTLQLIELGQNVVLDLNMVDVAENAGIKIDTGTLSKVLGIPVVETVANKGKGIEELRKKILEAAENPSVPQPPKYSAEMEDLIGKIEGIISGVKLGIPPRFAALKIVENDPTIWELARNAGLEGKLKKVIKEFGKRLGKPPDEALAEQRFALVHGLCKECITRVPKKVDIFKVTTAVDRVVTHPALGIPIFLAFLWFVFYVVFKVGGPLADLLGNVFETMGGMLAEVFSKRGVAPWLSSLVIDGLIGGVGNVLVFVPNLFLLYFLLAAFEDSGYMARAAFVVDRFMHLFGLHGKSFIPMILGFGCNVPAVMATRTLETEKDRVVTILIIPLMSCTARLPVYILFAGTFFGEKAHLVVWSLYVLGVLLAIPVARIFGKVFFKGEYAPLIMELPPYHMPNLKIVTLVAWRRTWLFIKKAGTVIFAATVVAWALASLPPGVGYGTENTLAGYIGKALAPLFKPAGYGFWKPAVALLFGFFAKEAVVGTLGTLYGAGENGQTLGELLKADFSPLSALSFLIMVALYIPCVATIAVIKQEAGTKWAILATVYTVLLGWTASVVFYQIAHIFAPH